MNVILIFQAVVLIILLQSSTLLAVPDAHLRPVSIESYIRDRISRDTLRLENRGDEDLEWEVVIDAEIDGHLSISPESGTIRPDRRALIVLAQDGRNIEEGDHFYGELVFTTNDPAAEVIEVPIAGHRVVYPMIGVSWPDGWGAWWGIDMNNFIENLEWGSEYRFSITIHNYGWTEMDVYDIMSNNGYFEFDPTEFNLNARSSRQVRVIFTADEVGQNSATITSDSDAWDPRELAFRIVSVVEPVYRNGSEIQDFIIEEDSEEILVADLDTVFTASDRSRVLSVEADHLISRIERSAEFYLKPQANWHGQSEVIVSAELNDSVLTDTFMVVVTEVADPPQPFDLIHPADGDTIHFGNVDSLDLFIWQSSDDPDGDTLHYSIHISPNGSDSTYTWGGLSETSITRSILQEIIDTETGGLFDWMVTVSDGELERNSWSSFTNYIPPAGIIVDVSNPVRDYNLVSVYPNPFNSGLNIKLTPLVRSSVKISAYELNGRLIEIIHEGIIPPGMSNYIWRRPTGVSGLYIIKIKLNDELFVVPAVLSK